MKIMISKKKKVKHAIVHNRKSERIMTLKMKDTTGPGKHPENPIVTTEDDISIGLSKSARRMKNCNENDKGT